MIGSDGSIIIDTRINSDGFNSGIKGMNNEIRKLGKTIFSVFGIGLLTKLGKEAIELGSDLQEVQNVVDVTFTTMSDKVNEFAKGAAEAAGLSETMAKKYVGTFGAMAKAFGFAESESYNMATALTQLSGDVASFYNLTQDEAYTKLKSVFTGETETLKDLGVVMTQSALDSYAMAEGYGKTTKQMSEQEKVALRYSFVLDQLSAAQGDFVRTSDSWANMTRVLSLNFDSLKANIGQALINIFTPFLKVINQIVSKMAELSRHFVAFSELLVGKSTSGGGGSPGDALGEITDGYEDIADATDEATKAQKNYLSGLDEIRTYTPQQTEGDKGTSEKITVPSIPGKEKEEIKETDGLLSKLEERFSRLIQFLEDVKNKIKEIFEDIKLGDFKELGKDISELAITIFDFISESIDSIDWESIGKKIGEFLKGIKWIDLIKSALKLKYNIWKAIAEVWFGSFKAAPIETAVLTALGLLKFTGLGKLLTGKILGAFSMKNLFSTMSAAWTSLGGLTGILTADLATVIGAGTLAEIGLTIGTGIIGGITAAILGFEFGKWLGEHLFPEDAEWYKNFTWFGEDGFFDTIFNTDPDILADAFINMITDMWNSVVKNIGNWGMTLDLAEGAAFFFQKIKEDFQKKDWGAIGLDILNGILLGITAALSAITEPFIDLFNWIWDGICKVFGIHSPAREMEPLGENILLGIVQGFENSISVFGESIKKWWNNEVTPWFTKEKWLNMLQGIKNAFTEIWEEVKRTVSNIVDGILTKISEMFNAVSGIKAGGLSGSVGSAIGGGGLNISLNIPKLATGAVIPPNAPFMAILGDQKRGTNIEAPLSTIESALDNVLNRRGGTSGSITLHNVIQVNRRTLYDEFIEEAKLRMSTTNQNPFELT